MDLGFRTRVAVAVAWIALQLGLVLTGGRRADAAFGFRMFPESSTIVISLTRELSNGQTVPVQDGRWVARGPDGKPHDLAWTDRIKDPVLCNLDVQVHASYGANAQLTRLQSALDDVLAHADQDVETVALNATVVVRKNGHEPTTMTFSSRRRL
jgi:hypothetical protein